MRIPPPRFVIACALALVAGLNSLVVSAADLPPLPQYGTANHLGVSTCGGSTCHASAHPWKNSMVLQNEFLSWSNKDKHSKSFAALESDLGKRIATNLGMPNATEQKVCLDCHADNVAPEHRSKSFALSDGVVCEACHGGAEHWLGQHVSGSGGHRENLAAGAYPTDNLVARGHLCLSCHIGDANKAVTHRMLGAGHPRMRFELDTFTAAQPAHFRVDADYIKRKGPRSGVQAWTIGQALQVQAVMSALADPRRNHDGRFPELAFYDCEACHHRIEGGYAQLHRGRGGNRTGPRLNDSGLLILQVIADQTNPQLGATLRRQAATLNASATSSLTEIQNAAAAVAVTAGSLADKLATTSYKPGEYEALLNRILERTDAAAFADFAGAEQATLAMSALIDAMDRAGMFTPEQRTRMLTELENANRAIDNDAEFSPQKFIAAVQGIARSGRGAKAAQ